MKTQAQMQKDVENPEIIAQATTFANFAIISEYGVRGEFQDTESFLKFIVFKCSLCSVIAALDYEKAEKEIAALKDENAALRKQLIPDGMPPDLEYPGDEPQMP